jgi:hypothetical protein
VNSRSRAYRAATWYMDQPLRDLGHARLVQYRLTEKVDQARPTLITSAAENLLINSQRKVKRSGGSNTSNQSCTSCR